MLDLDVAADAEGLLGDLERMFAGGEPPAVVGIARVHQGHENVERLGAGLELFARDLQRFFDGHVAVAAHQETEGVFLVGEVIVERASRHAGQRRQRQHGHRLVADVEKSIAQPAQQWFAAVNGGGEVFVDRGYDTFPAEAQHA